MATGQQGSMWFSATSYASLRTPFDCARLPLWGLAASPGPLVRAVPLLGHMMCARSSRRHHPDRIAIRHGTKEFCMAVTEPSHPHTGGTTVGAANRSTPPSPVALPKPPRRTSTHTGARTSLGHNKASPNGRRPASVSSESVRAAIAQLRDEACAHYRPQTAVAAPIRLMARMVKELEAACRERGYPPEIVANEVVNRTIGDVDLRRVSATDDGPEFVSLADEMGIALPGEVIGGHRATGATYRWIHERMLDFERALLQRGF